MAELREVVRDAVTAEVAEGRDPERLWAAVSPALADEIGVEKFARWFHEVKPLAVERGALRLGVPNLFILDWIRSRYLGAVGGLLSEHGIGCVELKVDGELYRRFREEESRFLAHPPGGSELPEPDSSSGGSGLSTCEGEGERTRGARQRPSPWATSAAGGGEGRHASRATVESDDSVVPAAPSNTSEPTDPPPPVGSTQVGSPRDGSSAEYSTLVAGSGNRSGPEALVRGAGAGGGSRGLDARLTLERFVVGAGNHVAHSAALEVLREPGRTYNPLFVYGGSGLGKTHLLQGLTRQFFKRGARRIRYLPCEGFVNRFVSALRERTIDRFRESFRKLRVLVIDDVHVLARKVQTQLELLHTVDAIASAGGQVIFASDTLPQAIALQKQLQGRFVSGLVCRVDPPDEVTRVRILEAEARSCSCPVPREVIAHIARAEHENVRILIGTLVRVAAFATLLGEDLTPDLAERVLREQHQRGDDGPRLAVIQEVAARHRGVDAEILGSASRARTATLARQEAMYVARVLTGHSLAEIGAHFGGRTHATVSFACRKVSQSIERDREYREHVEGLLRELRGRL